MKSQLKKKKKKKRKEKARNGLEVSNPAHIIVCSKGSSIYKRNIIQSIHHESEEMLGHKAIPNERVGKVRTNL